jgi:dipeptidyl aminopeptidase/acylaminoacyl peptidase
LLLSRSLRGRTRASDRDHAKAQPQERNADGARRQRLTAPPGWSASRSWSPDGHQFVFVLARNGPPRITVMRNDGTGQRTLTAHPGEHRTPLWSPDGRHIAFLSKEEGGHFDLYAAQADGSHLRRVATRPPGVQPDVKSFVWLPDGRLAYSNRTGPAQEGVTIDHRRRRATVSGKRIGPGLDTRRPASRFCCRPRGGSADLRGRCHRQ